jgi:hypothetical protein
VLRVKTSWRFAMNQAPGVETMLAEVIARCDTLFLRARDAGLFRADVDLLWARRAYHALVDEASRGAGDEDPGALATAIVHTLLHDIGIGIGTDTARL